MDAITLVKNTSVGAANILIVDDDSKNARLLATLVGSDGYATAIATSGGEALARIVAEPPDLILLDAMMPVMDGFQVAARLKADAATRSIPIIMVTALDDRKSRLRGLEAGVEEFVTKPVDRSELMVRVRNLLRLKHYSDLLNQHNSFLEHKVQERTAQLRDSHRETIYRLTAAAEYKDEDTGEHLRRISAYTAELAQHLGLDATFVETIFYASPMHDVGKIAIPDQILLKPSSFTAAEWEIMKTHAAMGAELLAGGSSPYLQMGAEIALSHHERWDGSGYPQGLRGEAIPISARIMNLCDQYDALRSQRPYKAALDHETVVEIITRGDGRTRPQHFDPAVLAAFKQCAETFKAIYVAHDQGAVSKHRTIFLAGLAPASDAGGDEEAPSAFDALVRRVQRALGDIAEPVVADFVEHMVRLKSEVEISRQLSNLLGLGVPSLRINEALLQCSLFRAQRFAEKNKDQALDSRAESMSTRDLANSFGRVQDIWITLLQAQAETVGQVSADRELVEASRKCWRTSGLVNLLNYYRELPVTAQARVHELDAGYLTVERTTAVDQVLKAASQAGTVLAATQDPAKVVVLHKQGISSDFIVFMIGKTEDHPAGRRRRFRIRPQRPSLFKLRSSGGGDVEGEIIDFSVIGLGGVLRTAHALTAEEVVNCQAFLESKGRRFELNAKGTVRWLTRAEDAGVSHIGIELHTAQSQVPMLEQITREYQQDIISTLRA